MFLRKKKMKKLNNEGSSIILVIVTVAFISMLVASVVYMAYYNYLMKNSDRSAKNNFYTAETVLDEINMGLQRELSDAMAEAYTKTSKLSGISVEEKEGRFQDEILQSLKEKLKMPTNDGFYQVNKLILYLDKTRYDVATGTGAEILTTDGEAVLVSTEPDRLTLKDVYVQYTDQRGYVSRVKTDIVIGFPDIKFVSNKMVPDIENYCLIANVRLVTESSTVTEITGSVYGGYEGIFSVDHSQLTFKGTNAGKVNIVANSVNVENSSLRADGFVADKGSELWTGGINVTSANISLKDTTYVADDLTVEGRDSNILIAGGYFGYGRTNGKAEGSSSILINGANTSLDMSEVQNLFLLGHAYVGARHYDPNLTGDSDYVEDADSITTNPTDPFPRNEDFMLGQSVAVKSDQLMYMVPVECMGYEGNVQVLAKNPITLEEYNMLTKTTVSSTDKTLKYTAVRLDKMIAKLGKPANNYGVSCRPVFRRVNGSILVYYYLVFNSETMANRFFTDYYNADKEALDAYIKEYIASFRFNESITDLHLAGNLVHFNHAGVAVLRPDTAAKDVDGIADLNTTTDKWVDCYAALSAKLLKEKTYLSATELGKTVYENIIVSETEFNNVVPSGVKEFNNSVGAEPATIRALVVNNAGDDHPFEINSSNSENLYLVIANGDVRVNVRQYNGLVIAGGTITLSPACKEIIPFAENVIKALNCKDSTETYCAGDVLKDKDAYLNYTAEEDEKLVDENGYINIEKLIHYENWNKR